MTDQTSVVIVGGGISGLTAAYRLHRRGVGVVVLEAGSHAGGTMRTMREGGWMIETGPNSALETTPLFNEMFHDLGITGDRLYAPASSNKRYILRDGRLQVLPMSPLSFVATSLWSARGKLRLLGEPFIGRAAREETVAEFVSRRLGREFLDYAINPFVAGVFAGDPAKLSVRSAFPKLYSLEENYGGLVKGMIRGAGERRRRAEKAKDRARMFSFAAGMQTFPAAIARALGDRVRCECEVTSIARAFRPGKDGERSSGAYAVSFVRGGHSHSLRAEAVIVAIPAYHASVLLDPLAPGLGSMLESIYYPPVAEVFLGFPAGSFTIPLDGFGFLVPEVENRRILGTIWSSSLFPERAPSGHVALTTFVGGSRQPELLRMDDASLRQLVLDELRSIMGAKGEPVFSRIIRWHRAIPQYHLGHQRIMEAVDRLEQEHPGVFVCANFRGGIAVGDCVMNGDRTASRAAAFVGQANSEGIVTQPIGA